MSVLTTADEMRDSAIEHVREAIKDLSAIVVDRCDGSADYTEVWLDLASDALHDLIKIKRNLEK
jgi:hypothetical protein